MSSDQYKPTEEGMKFAFVAAATEKSDYWDAVTEEEAEQHWDAFIAYVRRDAWEQCAQMAAHYGAFDGGRFRWLSSINPYRKEQNDEHE